MAASCRIHLAGAPLSSISGIRLLGLLSALLAGPAARPSETAESELDIALAGVVDTRLWPEEAAALEVRPYRMLLEKVRSGPDEKTMRFYVVKRHVRAETLLRTPDEFRGVLNDVPAATVVEIRREAAPGVGRTDRCEVYAGLAGRLQRSRATRELGIELWAFRALRLPGEPMLYPGDKVNLSGYFFKNVAVVDAGGGVHWMPLLVCPWPTFRRWLPLGPQLAASGMAGLLPTRDYPHEEVRARPVLDIEGNGRLALDGAPVTREQALAELRRYAFRHPGRAAVVRLAPGARGEIARSLKEESGLRRMLVKDLPQLGAP